METRYKISCLAVLLALCLGASQAQPVTLSGSAYAVGPSKPPVASTYTANPAGCKGSSCTGWTIAMDGNPQRANSVVLNPVPNQQFNPNTPALLYGLLSISATNAGLMHPMDAPVPIVDVQAQLIVTIGRMVPMAVPYPIRLYWSPSNAPGAPPNNAAALTLSVANTDVPFKVGSTEYVLKIAGLVRATPGQAVVPPPPRNIGGSSTWSVYIAQGETNAKLAVIGMVSPKSAPGVAMPRG